MDLQNSGCIKHLVGVLRLVERLDELVSSVFISGCPMEKLHLFLEN